MIPAATIQQGALNWMVPQTADFLGPLRGSGIARRIQQIGGEKLALHQETVRPLRLRLRLEGAIASEWGQSENNRRVRFYRLRRASRKRLQAELQGVQQTADVTSRFLTINAETESCSC